tara:strand:+ start:7599 stop:8099 length:501 start_codon:yes stop_codon:yes gene_type:complete
MDSNLESEKTTINIKIEELNNIIEKNWLYYSDKKILLDLFTYNFDLFNNYILEINNKINDIKKELNYYELIYIKENINNYSNKILSNINNLKFTIENLENSILFYKIKNQINYYTIYKIKSEIYILQDLINNFNKQKYRIIRWSSDNNINNMFELNLDNILSKSNN